MVTIGSMDMPVNCRSCPLKEIKIVNVDGTRNVMYRCLVADIWVCYCDLELGRNKDCPLKEEI